MSAKNRGFVINHQRVQLELDFAGHIKGTTWLTVRPTAVRLEAVYLHAGQALSVSSVTLSAEAPHPLPELPASFVHLDPLSGAFSDLESGKLIDQHPEYKRKLWTAMAEKEEGELCIDVRYGWVRLPELQSGESASKLAEFVIRIEYEVEMKDVVGEGVVFRRPGDNGLTDRIPHIFLNSSSHSSSRQWVPCIDSAWARHSWELEIIAPTYLQRIGTQAEADVLGESSKGSRRSVGEDRVVVVASGELEEQITHPDDPKKTIWYYLQTSPLSVQHVTFAAGPFVVYHIPPSAAVTLPTRQVDGEEAIGGEAVAEEDNQPLMLAFGLAGYQVELEHTVGCMRQAMDFYNSQYGSYPFSSFKMVFVEDPSPQCAISGTMAVMSAELLYPPEVVEQAYITRPILTHALAAQWMGVNVVPRTYSDTWLTMGLALYMNAIFLRSLLGNNEYRFKLRCDIERCVALDRGEQFPLQIPGDQEPPDEARAVFMALKAPLVLHILDRRLAKVGTSLGLARIIPKVFLDSLSGDLTNNMVSTNYFLRTCKKASGVDLSGFQEEWISGSGCPAITISADYKHGTGLFLTVKHKNSPAYRSINKTQPNMLPWKKPTQTFEGTLTIRIHEGEDPPAEHIIDLEQGTSIVELPYHTKDRRYRSRPGPRKSAAKLFAELQATGAAMEGTAQAGSDPGAMDEREWILTDFSELERSAAEKETGFDWLSFDPDCEWICTIEYDQSNVKGPGQDTTNMLFWASQLRFDRDIIGQRQAIRRLQRFPSPLVSSTLIRVVRDDSYSIRIRMEAVEALTQLTVRMDDACPSLAAFHILKLYKVEYCLPAPAGVQEAVFPALKMARAHYTANPPDPDDLEEHLLYKAVVAAVSRIRFDKSDDGGVYAQTLVRTILISVLDLAQPEGTCISPSFTVASVIAGLSTYFSDAAIAPRKMNLAPIVRAIEMIQRWLSLDKLVPSYGNVVTIAGLQTLLAAKMLWNKGADPLSAAVPYFLPYTREGNNLALRKVALDCVAICQPLASWTIHYFMRIIAQDSSLSMRQHAADSLSRCWLLRLALGEVPGLHNLKNNILEGEQAINLAAKALSIDIRKDVAAMRSMLADAAFLRSELTKALQTTTLATGSLLAILRAAEVVISVAPVKLRLSLGASNQPSRSLTLRIPGAMSKDRRPEDLQENESKLLLLLLQNLQKLPDLQCFCHPVPRDETIAPGYHGIIKQPMDFSRIQQKLLHSQYLSRSLVREDLQLIVENAKAYNRDGEPVYLAAEMLELEVKKVWHRLEKLLAESVANSTSKAAIPGLPPRPGAPLVIRITKAGAETEPAPGATPSIRIKGASAVRFADSSTSQGINLAGPSTLPAVPGLLVEERTTKAIGGGKPKPPRKQVKRERDDTDDLLWEEIDMMAGEGPERKSKGKAGAPLQIEPLPKKQKGPMGAPVHSERKIKVVKPDLSRQGSSSASLQAGKPATASSAQVKMPVVKLSAKAGGTLGSSTPLAGPSSVKLAASIAPAAPPLLYREDLDRLPNQKTPYRHARGKKFMTSLLAHRLMKNVFDVTIKDDLAPNYSVEIAKPRDLTTMSRNAAGGFYADVGQLLADVKLIVSNCRQYNGANSSYEPHTVALEDMVLNLWPALSSPAPDEPERKLVNKFIETSIKGNGVWFRDPVDETVLPGYYDRISRADARNFSAIQTRLMSPGYRSFDELDGDIFQLCKNALTFNFAGTEPHSLALSIGKAYESARRQIEATFRPKMAWR